MDSGQEVAGVCDDASNTVPGVVIYRSFRDGIGYGGYKVMLIHAQDETINGARMCEIRFERTVEA